MNKAQAIKQKCSECSGDSPKAVTLCNIVDCPLWPFRFGYSFKDKRYMKRMQAAKRNHSEEYQEMLKLISDHRENMPDYLGNVQIDAVLETKTPKGSYGREKGGVVDAK